MKDIYELSELTGLDYVETTEGLNGYPKNIKKVLDASALSNFKEVEEIAEKYTLEIIEIHRKDGWQLWESKGWINKAFEITSEDYGDNYATLDKMTEDEFLEDEIKPYLNNFDNVEELENFVNVKKEVWEEVENMEDNETVVTNYGGYYETVNKNPLSWSHDTHNYKVALTIK